MNRDELCALAAAGMLAGCRARQAEAPPAEVVNIETAPQASASAVADDQPLPRFVATPKSAAAPRSRECCKGMNDCKGKGNCKVDRDHDCAGMNECKGKGGCRSPDCKP